MVFGGALHRQSGAICLSDGRLGRCRARIQRLCGSRVRPLRDFIRSILEFGAGEFGPRRWRLLILDWNARSLAAARSVGFDEEGTIRSTEGVFVVMTGTMDESAPSRE